MGHHAVRIPLLDSMPEDARRLLMTGTRRRSFDRGEILFHEGDSGEALYVVTRGHIALRIHTPVGDVATLRIVGPGEFCGELALLAPGRRNATAAALDRAEVLIVVRRQFEALRTSQHVVDDLLITALATEVRRLATRLVDVMYLPVEARVWRVMSDLAETFAS